MKKTKTSNVKIVKVSQAIYYNKGGIHEWIIRVYNIPGGIVHTILYIFQNIEER